MELVNLLESEGVLPSGSSGDFLPFVDKVRKGDKYWVPNESGARFY
jgi:hypothetical protein